MKQATINTNYGPIVLQFLPEVAPQHVENFISLALARFYDGTRFHRVIPGFMIQGGDPNSRDKPRSMHGQGGPAHRVPAEFNSTPHERGVLSMARSQDPNSAGSQFFICVGDAKFLDNNYTAFGRVVSGMEVVDKIVSLKRDQSDNPVEGVEAVMESVTVEDIEE